MADQNDHYTGALLEELNGRMKLVMEALEPLKSMQSDIKELKEYMIKANKRQDLSDLVIRHQRATLNNHESRLNKLEST